MVPPLRKAGTALATVCLQGVGVVYLVRRGYRRGIYEGARLHDYLPDRFVMRELVSQSAPTTLTG